MAGRADQSLLADRRTVRVALLGAEVVSAVGTDQQIVGGHEEPPSRPIRGLAGEQVLWRGGVGPARRRREAVGVGVSEVVRAGFAGVLASRLAVLTGSAYAVRAEDALEAMLDGYAGSGAFSRSAGPERIVAPSASSYAVVSRSVR